MKWSITAAVFTASSLSVALPTVPGPDTLPYRLRLQSGNPKLNNQYLSTNGTDVGVFASGPEAPKPLLVYTVTDKKTGLVELHTYPAGKDSRLLALVGEHVDGLLSLANLADPESIRLEPGATCDWRSFRLGGGNSPSDGGRGGSPPRPGNAVTYAGAQGSWAAFPAGTSGKDFTVSFKGPDAWYPSIDMPIEVLYVPAYDADDGLVTIMS